jgi:16S rRNA (guanine966-N2)-methyltransferase
MRVIAGRFRSRPLLAPAGLDTRPTADRLRETLFNVLTQGAVNRVEGAAFLDLYAGSGAVGIEALSRDARHVTFVEQAPTALTVLEKNLDNLGLRGTAIQLGKHSVERFLRGSLKKTGPERFSVIFLDPPYASAEEYALTLKLLGGDCAGLMADGAIVVAEHGRKITLEASYEKLVRTRLLMQGDAVLSFYEISSPLESE